MLSSRQMLSWGPSRGQPDKGDLSTWGFAAPLADPVGYESSRAGLAWQHQQLQQQQQQDQLQEPRKRGNVRWGSAQHQLEAPAEEEEDILLEHEQSSRRATGRSKRGSFFPDNKAALNGQARPGTAFMGTPNRGGTAGARQADSNLRCSDHNAASLAFGYQPYSLKDYREHHFDPKSFEYWMLGKLGPGPVSKELQHKKEVVERVRDISAAIRSRNVPVMSTNAVSQPRDVSPSTWGVASPHRRGKNASAQRTATARDRAQQYADALPKPAPHRRTTSCVKQRSSHLQVGQPGVQNAVHSSAAASLKFTDDMDLEQMQILHAQQRQQVEALRRKFPALL